MSVAACCLKGFAWNGTPTGRVEQLTDRNQAYVTGNNTDIGVLVVHDLFGWTFPNIRLLADHIANEVGATVYVPDFFDGEVLPFNDILEEKFANLNIPAFMKRNSREAREPEIFACARALRSKHAKVGAVGYCYGAWAVFRLAAAEHQPPIVDCVSAGHPSLLVKEDIDGVRGSAVPVQILAPEIDPVYTAELKSYTFETLQKNAVPFEYQHFPGVAHACLVRGDERKPGEREAMAKGKTVLVSWFKLNLS